MHPSKPALLLSLRSEASRLARCLLLALAALDAGCARYGAGRGALPAGWDNSDPIQTINAPFPMPQLARPVFPNRFFNIKDYGAVGDGATLNTAAIAATIDACAKAGGGHVVVPAGNWFTGPIHLKSNVDLRLAEGATLKFSDRFEDYLPPVLVRVGGIDLYNYSPMIYARDCENVAITGPGKIDGNGKNWWAWQKLQTTELFDMGAQGVPVEQRVFGTPEAAIRPSLVSFINCKNVLWEGFTVGGGPNWTLHPIYCENVIVRKVNVETDGPNNDGLDPDSCRNMLIEQCVFSTGDDCVVLKSGYNEDGWRVGKPTENVVMRFCSSKRGHGGLVVGSEMSGDVRNVYMHDCEFEGTDRAVRIKSKRGRGGVVENIWVENVQAANMQREAVIMNMDYSGQSSESNQKAPLFRNIHIKGLQCTGALVAIRLTGLDDSPIQNIDFDGVHIASQRGVIAEHVKELHFSNMTLTNAEGPPFDLTDAFDIFINNVAWPMKGKFAKLSGPHTDGVIVEGVTLPHGKDDLEFADGAPGGMAVFKPEKGFQFFGGAKPADAKAAK